MEFGIPHLEGLIKDNKAKKKTGPSNYKFHALCNGIFPSDSLACQISNKFNYYPVVILAAVSV